jgi:hypothetical protein
VALQLLLLALFLLYLGHSRRNSKFKASVLLVTIALMLTHHLTSIYLVLVICGYVALVNLLKHSRGVLDLIEAKQDTLMTLGVLVSFMIVSATLGRYETKIPFQDVLLLLSLFFLCIGFGRLLISSSFMASHRRFITVAFVAGMVGFPLVANRVGLFSYAPWEQVMPMIAPHLIILGFAVIAVFPITLLSEEQKAFLLAWLSAVMPFLFFGVVKRDLFGYILFFRNVAYGYQLAAVLLGIGFVYLYKRFEWDHTSPRRRFLVVTLAVLLACDIGLASYMGFLSQDYERKDLYTPREFSAAVQANASTLRGQLLGSDERLRRLLLYVTREDGDQLTTYLYLTRTEKYIINQIRNQFNLTDRPLTHLFLYYDMYRVGFLDTVLFQQIVPLSLNRFEDIVYDDGENKLIYVARKDWP